MKRLLAISLVAVVSFGVLAGCAPKEDEAPAPTAGAEDAQKGGGATMDTSTK